MMLDVWAFKHNISLDALAELRALLYTDTAVNSGPAALDTEAWSQQQIRLEAPRRGVTLWRNNRGAVKTENGMLRFGLANDSAAMDKLIKSHDLIGITPHVVTAADVGRTVGIFTSYECKAPGWKWGGTARERAQKKWAELILSLGGIAKFVRGPHDIWSK